MREQALQYSGRNQIQSNYKHLDGETSLKCKKKKKRNFQSAITGEAAL